MQTADLNSTVRRSTRSLVIDREIVRRGLASVLKEDSPFNHVVATVESVNDALVWLRSGSVDLAIINVAVDGLAAAFPDFESVIVVLLIPEHLPERPSYELIGQADAVVHEPGLTSQRLAATLQAAVQGHLVLKADLVRQMFEWPQPSITSSVRLTPRETAVLELMALGKGNKEIARDLAISTHGVKRHAGNIMMKLSCSNRTMAVATAIGQGLIGGSPDSDLADDDPVWLGRPSR